MNKNMRKMYTEEEIINLIKKANSDGDVILGTRIYNHWVTFRAKEGQTISEGCETSLSFRILSLNNAKILVNQYLNFVNAMMNTGFLQASAEGLNVLSMYVSGSGANTQLNVVVQHPSNSTSQTYILDKRSKYDVDYSID